MTGSRKRLYDPWLLYSIISLLIFGLVMVASASIAVSERQFQEPFHFLLKQFSYAVAGCLLAFFIIRIEIETWRKYAMPLLFIAFGLLVLVLLPGMGKHINGSVRWLSVGPISIQVSEIAKFFTIVYFADYLVRREVEVKEQVMGFIKPMMLLSIIGLLLLKEPDFGALMIITLTTLTLMFLAGVRFGHYLILFASATMALILIAISSPYRVERFMSFLNPWANQYASGYQLTQSLIAFGRGGLTGVGLGNSVQKLFYLPEAQADFLMAIIAEELGLIGVMCVLGLFILMSARIFIIVRKAFKQNKKFHAYLAFGIVFWIAIQTIINMGVATGLLPTKGLTLPFMSAGGSSLMVMMFVMAIIFRIDFELRNSYGYR
jgi:cell division protein FtsW